MINRIAHAADFPHGRGCSCVLDWGREGACKSGGEEREEEKHREGVYKEYAIKREEQSKVREQRWSRGGLGDTYVYQVMVEVDWTVYACGTNLYLRRDICRVYIK
jgi:hypothetical protein